MDSQNFKVAAIYISAMILAAGLNGLINASPPVISARVIEKNEPPAAGQILINPIYWPREDDLYSPNLFALAPRDFPGAFLSP